MNPILRLLCFMATTFVWFRFTLSSNDNVPQHAGLAKVNTIAFGIRLVTIIRSVGRYGLDPISHPIPIHGVVDVASLWLSQSHPLHTTRFGIGPRQKRERTTCHDFRIERDEHRACNSNQINAVKQHHPANAPGSSSCNLCALPCGGLFGTESTIYKSKHRSSGRLKSDFWLSRMV